MLGLTDKTWGNAAICGVLCLAAVACAATSPISQEQAPMTLGAFYSTHGIPSNCGDKAAWEGKSVILQGIVDPDNIFDKQGYPDLPYEKFKLIDGKGHSIEVWVQTADSRTIFSRVKGRKGASVTVSGTLAAVKMSIMGKCRLGARVLIEDPSQIQ